MESLVAELQCAVCLELYTCPIILPCSHVLCRTPCAERIFIDDFVRCPVCRENSFVTGGIASLPRVISLENIIEQYRNPALPAPAEENDEVPDQDACGPNDIPCQLCQDDPAKRAVRSCLHCNASYCQRCLTLSHPEREPFVQHQLVEPKQYARPTEPRCPRHEGLVSVWCQTCQVLGCLFCSDDPQTHQGHCMMSIDQAAAMYKELLEGNLKKLSMDQNLVQMTVSRNQHRLDTFKRSVEDRCADINEQCDQLISEIETKRDFFMSDLQYEERNKGETLNHIIAGFGQQKDYVQSVIHYTQQVLKEKDKRAFIQLAKLANDKAIKQPLTQGETSVDSSASLALNHKVVDMRKEKALLRDMTYLTVPDLPVIDMEKCSRSTHSVVLVLSAEEMGVLDGYRVYYSKEQHRPVEHWGTIEFTTPLEERKYGRTPTASNAVCLIHDNLDSGTIYYFAVRAYNAAGESELSPVANCATLSESQFSVPVPQIVENMCHTYSYSIQIHSPSPQDGPSPDQASHYLLYREASANKIWKSIPLVGRVDHRVFGLESDVLYDFVIMACGAEGECQVSNMVTLRTERAAY